MSIGYDALFGMFGRVETHRASRILQRLHRFWRRVLDIIQNGNAARGSQGHRPHHREDRGQPVASHDGRASLGISAERSNSADRRGGEKLMKTDTTTSAPKVGSSALFAFAVRPRAKRRVLMRFTDAGPGHPNWARFKCAKCGQEMETHTATDSDLRRGTPCPRCNEANSTDQ